MNTYDFGSIRSSVEKMLRVNMGLKAGEKVLFLCDVPGAADWDAGEDFIQDFALRTLMNKAAHRMAVELFPENQIDLYFYPSVGGHGVELPADAAEKMLAYDVIIAIGTWSLSHTNARSAASEKGIRIASCANLDIEMMLTDNVIDADYNRIAAKSRHIAELLTSANEVHITNAAGSDLRFSLAGRPGMADTGFYDKPGLWGNLPGGEAYAVPVEGTAEGRIVIRGGWRYNLHEDMTFIIESGKLVRIEGGGAEGDDLRAYLLGPDSPESRANVAELGIGTNYRASKADNVLETEKIDGTIHIGFGDNFHMGGMVSSDFHDDFVMTAPDMYLDGKQVMKDGQMLV